jgi:hypothetical protein
LWRNPPGAARLFIQNMGKEFAIDQYIVISQQSMMMRAI